jgi:hypothetical protein
MRRCFLLLFQLRGFAGAVAASLALALATGCSTTGVPSYEVTTYSYVTEAGRQVASPTDDHPARVLLVNGGYQEFGDPRARDKAAEPLLVATHVRDALLHNHFQPITVGEAPPDLLVVFQWGAANPETAGQTGATSHSALQRLDLVGGRALRNADLESERNTIHNAAADPRYFVAVAAYHYAESAPNRMGSLLWRTQISVPAGGLTQDRAVPLLTAVGGRLFGMDTPLPRRVWVGINGVLNTDRVGMR